MKAIFKIGDKVKPNAAGIKSIKGLANVEHLIISSVYDKRVGRKRSYSEDDGIRYYLFTNPGKKVSGLNEIYGVREAHLVPYSSQSKPKKRQEIVIPAIKATPHKTCDDHEGMVRSRELDGATGTVKEVAIFNAHDTRLANKIAKEYQKKGNSVETSRKKAFQDIYGAKGLKYVESDAVIGLSGVNHKEKAKGKKASKK